MRPPIQTLASAVRWLHYNAKPGICRGLPAGPPPHRSNPDVNPFSVPIATLLIATCAVCTGATGQKDSKTKKPAGKSAAASKARTDTGPLYAGRADAMQIADDIAERRNLDREWVRNAIGQSRYLAGIAKAVTPEARSVVSNILWHCTVMC